MHRYMYIHIQTLDIVRVNPHLRHNHRHSSLRTPHAPTQPLRTPMYTYMPLHAPACPRYPHVPRHAPVCPYTATHPFLPYTPALLRKLLMAHHKCTVGFHPA